MRHAKGHKPTRRGVTPQRKAAAEKRVKQEADKMALFPEMRRWHTAEERIEDMDNKSVAYFQRLRDADAKRWRDARKRYRNLSLEQQRLVMRHWNRGHLPADSGYFADLVTQAERGKLAAKERELEKCERIRREKGIS